jgi:hypothetical protein
MSDIRRGDRLGEFVCEAPLWSVAGGQWWRVRHGALPDVEAAALVAAPDGPLASRLAGLARSQDGLPADRLLGVRGIDTGATPPYLVLELPEGEWLRERLARGPCSSAEARLIVVGVADALGALHAAGTAFGGVAVEDVHLGNGARVRLGLAGAPVRAAAGAVAATRADDLRALASFTFALLTGTVPAGVLGPNDTTGLPDWAKRVVAKAQGLDGGYAEAAEVRADLETMVRAASAEAAAAAGVHFKQEPAPEPAAQTAEPIRIDADGNAQPLAPGQTRPGAKPRKSPFLWRLFWFPPRATAATIGFFAPVVTHVAWIALVIWGVHAWVDGDDGAERDHGRVVSQDQTRDVAGMFALAVSGDAYDRNAALSWLEEAAMDDPGAFQAGFARYIQRVVERDGQRRTWERTALRLEPMRGAAARMVLADLERMAADDALPGAVQDLHDHLRAVWEGEQF